MIPHGVLKRIEEDQATIGLVHPSYPWGIVGTKNGKVLIYEALRGDILFQFVFKKNNELGEEIAVIEPIIDLAFSPNLDFLYAFSKVGAYCISLETFSLFTEIPIEGELVGGDVNKVTGDIIILTQKGYLSRWAPKFHSRNGYFDIEKEGDFTRVRFIDKDNVLVATIDRGLTICNFKEMTKVVIPKFENQQLFAARSFITSNDSVFMYITKEGDIVLSKIDQPKMDIFMGNDLGNSNPISIPKEIPSRGLEEILDALVSAEGTTEIVETDLRFKRISKDKYDAATEMKSNLYKAQALLRDKWDPETILHFAIKDYVLNKRTPEGMRIILQICEKESLDPQLAIYAWKLNGKRPERLFSTIRRVMKDRHVKSERIRNNIIHLGTIYLLTILLVIFHTKLFPEITIGVSIVILGVASFIFRKGNNINRIPKIPYIEEYYPIRIFVFVNIMIGIGYLLINTLVLVIPIPFL